MPTNITGKEPIINLPYYNTYGMNLTYLSTTTLTVGSGQTRDETDTFDITLSSDKTLNSAVNGVNGLDTGTFAVSSLYYVFVIGDSSLNNSPVTLMSLSATDPVMPTGYDVKKRIGQISADGAAHIINFYQSGSRSERFYVFDIPQIVLNAGGAVAWAAIDMSLLVPSLALTPVEIETIITPANAGDHGYLRTTGSAAATGIIIESTVATFPHTDHLTVMASAAASIDYELVVTASATLTVNVVGYYDAI